MSSCTIQPSSGLSSARPRVVLDKAKPRPADRVAQCLLLATLYAVPALIGAHASVVSDPDIWWHLRTGEWIVQHRCVPRTDPFSALGPGQPWAAYSWLFEVVVFQLFRFFGIVGIVLYTAALLLAITVAVHHLIRRLQPDFSLCILLTLATCLSMAHLFTPRPWLFTILLFVLELDILMDARRTGRQRQLAWLPVLFALWANLHIQFVDGLLVLVLACAESLFAGRTGGASTRIRPTSLLLITLACILATLCNPYGWHIYRIAHDLAAQPGVLNKLQELQSIPFRDFSDWLVLALALAATAALGWARRLLAFETALLVFAVALSFRSQRDVWLLAVTAVAILASRVEIARPSPQLLPASATPATALMAIVAVLAGFRVMSINRSHLESRLAVDLPVRAAEFIKAAQYSGPIYNDYGWGGYLIWKLRLPVSIDGRAALYGDERIDHSDATWNGQPGWQSSPELQSSGVVIGPARAPLAQILRSDPHFRLAYEDPVAAVFMRRKP